MFLNSHVIKSWAVSTLGFGEAQQGLQPGVRVSVHMIIS